MARNHTGTSYERSEYFGSLQRLVDALFEELEEEYEKKRAEDPVAGMLGEIPYPTVRRLDVVIAAEAADLPEDLQRICSLVPPGDYTRQRLCDQINSAITGHAWGQVYGTVE